MKKLWKILLALALFLMPAFAEAAGNLSDQAKLLSSTEKQIVETELSKMDEKYSVHMMIVTARSIPGGNIGTYANRYLDNNLKGKYGNMVLMISMGSREWYISTDNAMRKKITDDKGIQQLANEMVPSMSRGNYYEAFRKYISASDKLLAYYAKEGRPYVEKSTLDYAAYPIILILSLLVGMAARSHLIAQMKNLDFSYNASSYLVPGSFRLNGAKDIFLFMNISRIRKPKQPRVTMSSRDGSHGGGGGRF